MMETAFYPRPHRGGRGGGGALVEGGPRRPQSRNRQWMAGDSAISRGGSASNGHSDSERWERGGHRGGGRSLRGSHRGGRRFPNQTYRPSQQQPIEQQEAAEDTAPEDEELEMADGDVELDSVIPEKEPEDFEKFYQDLVKAREAERKKAIADGKMDDPMVPKRLEDAITMVGTCMDMCPRFERYRRQRENNLFEWETIPGTKRVDHKRAVKMYERAAGDKTLPSDLRPPLVLKRTLDYLFHDLLHRGGFSETCSFVRDRTRAVRTDFTVQHETGPIAIECHDRCARFHVLALHFERDKPGFSVALEEQQFMNTLQSLKEFYEDQRGRYQSPTELEMRVYHRLIHIRDQKERHEDIPDHILNDPVFKLTTAFRLHVQKKSAPITKTSQLVVDEEALNIFGQLAGVLREGGNTVMIYLVACILERLFGKETIEDIESIRGGLTIPNIIDGVSHSQHQAPKAAHIVEELSEYEEDGEGVMGGDELDAEQHSFDPQASLSTPVSWPASVFAASQPAAQSIPASKSAFANLGVQSSATSVFGGATFGTTSSSSSTPGLGAASSVFGAPFSASVGQKPSSAQASFTPAFPVSTPQPQPPQQSQPLVLPTASPSNPFQIHSSSQRSTVLSTQPSSTPPLRALNAQATPFMPSGSSTGGLSFPRPIQASTDLGASLFGRTPPSASFTTTTFDIPLQPRKTPSLPKLITNTNEGSGLSFPATLTGAADASGGVVPTTGPMDSRASNAALTLPVQTNLQSEPSPIREPPPLGKSQPISLPSTPTGNGFFPVPPTNQPASKTTPVQSQGSLMMNHVKKSINLQGFTPSTPAGSASSPRSDLLSPLGFQSPLQESNRQGSSYFGVNALSLQFAPPVPSPLKPRRDSTNATSLVDGSRIEEVNERLEKWKGKEERMSTGEVVAPSEKTKTKLPLFSSESIKSKGKGKPRDYSYGDESPESQERQEPSEEKIKKMVKRAVEWERKSNVVKTCFKTWKDRTTDNAAYHEACRQSEAYTKKIRSGATANKRRALGPLGDGARPPNEDTTKAVSSRSRSPTASRKRARKRVSGVYQGHRTDEDLVKRLRENQEEQARRWARGTFLQVIRDYLVAKSSLPPPPSILYPTNAFASSASSRGLSFSSFNADASTSAPPALLSASTNRAPQSARSTFSSGSDSLLAQAWRLWLSMNPENDSTAIWLEKKFEVPDSGEWESEAVFGIPALYEILGAENPQAKKFPGLLFFERTPPAEGVDDDLEKKYRALDDCARLRDIIKSFPERRYFKPSLIVFQWVAADQVKDSSSSTEPNDEFLRMANNLKNDAVLLDYSILSVSSKTTDLDAKLRGSLETLQMDLEGQLVQELSLKGVYGSFEAEYAALPIEWLEHCIITGEFEWTLYGHFLRAVVQILRELGKTVLQLVKAPVVDIIPGLENGAQIQDEESAYDYTGTWLLSLEKTPAVEQLTQDLKSLHDMGKAFPIHTLHDQLRELLISLTESHLARQVENARPDSDPQHVHPTSLSRDTSSNSSTFWSSNVSTVGPPSIASRFQLSTASNLRLSTPKYFVHKSELTTSQESFHGTLQRQREKLRHALSLVVRRTPKRRGASRTSDGSSPSVKRRRFPSVPESETDQMQADELESFVSPEPEPQSDAPYGNGHATTDLPIPNAWTGNENGAPVNVPPSPTISVVSTANMGSPPATERNGSRVTASMLRAFTKEMMKKYRS